MKLVRMRSGEVVRGSRKPIYDFRNTNNNNDDVDDDDDEHNDVDVGKLFSIVMTPPCPWIDKCPLMASGQR